ncbi:MAG TPA: response regulator [Spirochaetota bacterium]|nr:response regulator [Spirochaetota bacterium]
MEKNITILIADDEKAARERLKGIINSLGYYISGEAINGDDAMSQIVSLKPQIAFLDINMPGTNVFNGIKSLDPPP